MKAVLYENGDSNIPSFPSPEAYAATGSYGRYGQDPMPPSQDSVEPKKVRYVGQGGQMNRNRSRTPAGQSGVPSVPTSMSNLPHAVYDGFSHGYYEGVMEEQVGIDFIRGQEMNDSQKDNFSRHLNIVRNHENPQYRTDWDQASEGKWNGIKEGVRADDWNKIYDNASDLAGATLNHLDGAIHELSENYGYGFDTAIESAQGGTVGTIVGGIVTANPIGVLAGGAVGASSAGAHNDWQKAVGRAFINEANKRGIYYSGEMFKLMQDPSFRETFKEQNRGLFLDKLGENIWESAAEMIEQYLHDTAPRRR